MIEGDINCTRCTLHKTCEYVCLMGKGPIPCDIMIIGEAPGFREDTTGQPFQGKAGKILDGLLEECGISRKHLYITNAVKCRPPQNSTPKKKEIAACSKYLMEEIAQVKPKFILLLGNTAAISVLSSSYPRLKMGEIRGRFFEVEETNIFATYHPSVAVRGISKYTNVMKSDIKRFFQVALTGEVPREEGSNLKIINSTEEFDDFMDRLEKEKLVSFDIETTELNPRLGKVVSLGFGLEKEQDVIPLNHRNGWLRGQFDAQKEFCEIIEEVLEGRTLIAHNGKFDSGWMSVQYGVDYSIDHDTMLMSHLIDENSQHGLKFLAEKYFAAQNYDISLEAKTGHVSLETLATYNGLDVYYTRKLFTDVFYPELEKDPALLKFYEIVVMPASRYFRDIEEHGVYINMSKLEEVEQHLNDQVTQLQNELDKLKPGVNWNSTKQVAEFLFKDLRLTPLDKTASGAYSTSESVMQRLARKHPAPQKILDLRAANKMLSTFITSWKEKAIDSRLHPSFKLHGTVTGRLSCSDPNLQQAPRDPVIRSLVSAPPGWTLVEIDFSQVELRVAAILSGDKEMQRAFIEGEDIHTKTARMTTGEEPPTDKHELKEWRKKAKAVNFGFLYGMGAKKFQEYARDKYQADFTMDECIKVRKRFFNTYSGLNSWYDRQIRVARMNGQVRSLTGRLRHLPDIFSDDDYLRSQAERQAINSVVQGFASDLTVMSLVEIMNTFSDDTLNIIGTVHDAILMEIRTEKLEEVLPEVKAIMESPALLRDLGVVLPIPIRADVSVGDWGVGKEWEPK